MKQQEILADLFQTMHQQNELLILPNVWDVGSAVVFENEGFQAIATTSAGIAYSLGYPDGEQLDISVLSEKVRQITDRVRIPVSCDFERGYSDDLSIIKQNAKMIIENGAVGLNIEDGRADGTLDALDFMLMKIRTLSQVKKETGINFVINARTCAYWLNIGSEEQNLNTAIERGNAFKDAGADCIFIPGALDKSVVETLVHEIDAPINVILNGVFHDIEELNKVGVQRLSLGSGAARSSYAHVIQMAKALSQHQPDLMLNHAFNYHKANEYFTKQV